MRYPASEKLEIIRRVEQSHLPARRTLEKLGVARATFYRWCDLYQTGGPEALADRSPRPERVWNRIPDDVRGQVCNSGRAGAVATGTGDTLHGHEKLFCLGGFCLSPAGLQELLRPGVIQALGDALAPAEFRDPRRPSSTMRIFSSAEYCMRVARRMSFTIRSEDILGVPDFWLISTP
jgi:hypothetical protein